jgi:hypothetical protein
MGRWNYWLWAGECRLEETRCGITIKYQALNGVNLTVAAQSKRPSILADVFHTNNQQSKAQQALSTWEHCTDKSSF